MSKPTNQPPATWRVTRRDFLKVTGVVTTSTLLSGGAGGQEPFRFGLFTDTHYADADMGMNRYFRESTAKLRECVDRMNDEGVAFMCALGDIKDQDRIPDEASTLSYLDAIEAEYARFNGPRHYVLGNHDLDSISKEQFLEHTAMPAPHYSFDAGGLHFVVLDACYDNDGQPYDRGAFSWMETNVPADQIAWLAEDLANANTPTVVFGHQRYDGNGPLFVNNAAEVRSVLENAGNVLAVFTGHDHPGDHNEINGIHYYTLVAVVEGTGPENNSYAIVDVADGALTVTGYRRAVSADLT